MCKSGTQKKVLGSLDHRVLAIVMLCRVSDDNYCCNSLRGRSHEHLHMLIGRKYDACYIVLMLIIGSINVALSELWMVLNPAS
jgi:hypothetical protein